MLGAIEAALSVETEAGSLDGAARSRLDGALHRIVDEWLREAGEIASRLSLAPTAMRTSAPGERPPASDGDTGADGDAGAERPSDPALELGRMGEALQAAASSRGALVERVHALRLEVGALKLKVSHVEESLRAQAKSRRGAASERRAEALAVRRATSGHRSSRDEMLAIMAELNACAAQASRSLGSWRSEGRRVMQSDTSHAGAGSSRARRLLQLDGVQPLVERLDAITSGTTAEQGQKAMGLAAKFAAKRAQSPTKRSATTGEPAPSEPAAAIAAAAAEGVGEGEGASAMGIDVALRLAVRRVMARRSERRSDRIRPSLAFALTLQPEPHAHPITHATLTLRRAACQVVASDRLGERCRACRRRVGCSERRRASLGRDRDP